MSTPPGRFRARAGRRHYPRRRARGPTVAFQAKVAHRKARAASVRDDGTSYYALRFSGGPQLLYCVETAANGLGSAVPWPIPPTSPLCRGAGGRPKLSALAIDGIRCLPGWRGRCGGRPQQGTVASKPSETEARPRSTSTTSRWSGSVPIGQGLEAERCCGSRSPTGLPAIGSSGRREPVVDRRPPWHPAARPVAPAERGPQPGLPAPMNLGSTSDDDTSQSLGTDPGPAERRRRGRSAGRRSRPPLHRDRSFRDPDRGLARSRGHHAGSGADLFDARRATVSPASDGR